MHLLTAVVLATPVFGFQLTVPSGQPSTQPVTAISRPLLEAAQDEIVESGPEPVVSVEDARRRSRLRRVHRALGIATWSAWTATVVFGAFQYVDRYGFFVDPSETRCAQGDALLGQWQCDFPVLHFAASLTTAALYASSFALSIAMANPDETIDPDSERARRLRTHKLLRWIHLAIMAGQIINGVIFANLGRMGVDNFTVRQAIATAHLTIGSIGWGALTWAGALMLF